MHFLLDFEQMIGCLSISTIFLYPEEPMLNSRAALGALRLYQMDATLLCLMAIFEKFW